MKSYQILLLLLILTACETTLTGYKFKINAVYEAPVSGFKMIVNSSGYVKSGSDMAETYTGSVSIEPFAMLKTVKSIKLFFSSDDDGILYEIDWGVKLKAAWGLREDFRSLNNILGIAGYRILKETEIRETIRAIGGALSGPKGVILEGQSEYINVIKVDYGDKDN